MLTIHVGIYAHSGHSYKSKNVSEIRKHAEQEVEILSKFAKRLRDEKGVKCNFVSIGSTPVCSHLPEDMGEVNEIHPGMHRQYQCNVMNLYF